MPTCNDAIEKPNLEIAFIPIVCAAPLIYAHSHGYFEENGLRVDLHAAPGWSGVKELLVHGLCDAAHMLSPMPFACRQGIDGPPADIRLSLIQNVNSQALTLARKHLGIELVRDMRGFTFGVPYRFSMHYYLLCHFLAANGIDPLKDVTIKEVSPPQMPYYLEKGWVDGVFAPEPFNQISVYRGTGFIFILSKEIWSGHPCCCFATHDKFSKENPNTHRALLRSVLQAQHDLHNADPEKRKQIAKEISAPLYLNQADSTPVEQALTGDFPDGRGNHFIQRDQVDFLPDPSPDFGFWVLAQMQRWAQLPGETSYKEAVESTIDVQVQNQIKTLNFKQANPASHTSIEIPHPNTPLTYVRSQPFCAYQDQADPLTEHKLPLGAKESLRAIISSLAKVAGGHFDVNVEVTSRGEIGHLERVLQEVIDNLAFSRNALAEQVEHLDHLVEQRTKSLTEEISVRELAEQRLRITQFSVDKAPELVMWLEANALVHYVNEAACTLLGYEAEEIIGHPVWSFCAEWPERRCLSDVGRLATDGSLSVDMNFRHKNGSIIPVELIVNELEYARGKIYYCVSGRDIRERTQTMNALKEAREVAEQATRTKSDFLATMSHEIRTPLTAILGYADALYQFGDIEKAPNNRLGMLSSIKRNGSHLLDLINDLLDLSQIESGQLALFPTPSSPLVLTQEVVANFLERAQSKEIYLRVECTTAIPRQINVDAQRFRQILTNLIGNAIKFTNEGSVTVQLAVRDSGSDTAVLALTVKDTGIGIPAEKQELIFEPFTHGHDRQDRCETGTGLGLSICRRLVAACGGEITVTSDVGKGSVFTFTVPFSPSSPMWQPTISDLVVQRTDAMQLVITRPNLTGTRILIVEDTPDTQDLLSLFLEDVGAVVDVASTGVDGVAKALDALHAGSPHDLILMDMRVPDLDGYAATRQLREEGFQSPIVALTAYAMKDDKQNCLDAGCDEYVTKPIDQSVLFEAIGRQLPNLNQPVLQGSSEVRRWSLVSEKVDDSRFLPLLNRYLTRLPEMLDQLQSARQRGEADSLCTVVHRLRGTATNYGFPQITEAADKCETALRAQDTPEQYLNESLDELTDLVGMAIDTWNNEEEK